MHRSLPRSIVPVLATLLVIGFFMSGLYGLGTVPRVQEDEPWLSAPGYVFWTRGYFGTDLFRGFFGMERHYYGFLPLFPMLLGASLSSLGMGLYQARLVPLLCTTLVLIFTYRTGSRLFSPRHGLMALVVLVLWPIALPTTYFTTGIPMMDFSRFIRNDILVPVFGLLALGASISSLKARVIPGPRRAFGIGLLAGLATMAHVYGAFWLLALILAFFWSTGRSAWRFAVISGAGLLLTQIPWLLFVGSGYQDFALQNHNYQNRFELLDPGFYLQNLSREWERYNLLWYVREKRVAPWIWAGLVITGLGVTVSRALRSEDVGSRALLCLLATLAGLSGLLLTPKNYSYTAMLWPPYALLIAVGVGALWSMGARARFIRVLLVLTLCLPLWEGVRAETALLRAVPATTPYRALMERVGRAIPPGSRVLGFQQYWFGLVERFPDYRTLLVPVFLSDRRYADPPLTFGAAADLYPPDILLMDPVFRRHLEATAAPDHPYHWSGKQIEAYLAGRRAHVIGTVEDESYGRFEILKLEPAQSPPRASP